MAIETIYPLIVRGGVMIFDDYGIPDWSGETKAVDQFLEKNPKLKINTSSISNVTGAWIIKP